MPTRRGVPLTPVDRGLAARRRYYEALVREVTERGFEGVSIAGVIARAGGSKGAFYHHFEDKWHLLERWYHEHTWVSVRNATAETVAGNSIEEAISDEILRVVRAYSGERGLFIPTALRFMVFAFDQQRFRALIAENYDPKIALTRQLVMQGIETGEFRRGIDVDTFAHVLTAGLFGVYLFHYAAGARGDLADKVRRYLHLLFGAVRV